MDMASLRMGVLGPMEAVRDGDKVSLGPAKQQAVLAMLVLAAGRPVSRDEIIDGVWGEEVPQSAANLVATYIAGLRRALDPGRARRTASTVLTSSRLGYALRPDHVDLEAFEHLVAQAQRAEPVASARLLGEALALWRGQPLDGLPGPFAAAERRRLAERQLVVLEQRIETGLALGEHADWVAELTRLVATYPYRERMRGVLMLALYRGGRQAEALGVFDEGRRALTENLGIEPGTDLLRLHHQILTADPSVRLSTLPAARVYRLLDTLDAGEVTVPVVAAVAGCAVPDAERALRQLVDAGLVECRAPGSYQVRRESSTVRRDAVERAVRHYLASVRRADRLLRPARMIPSDGYADQPTTPEFAATDDALAWLERERGAIVSLGVQAAATPGIDPMLVATLVTDLRAFMHRRGHWDDLGRLAEAAVAAARRDGHDHAAALAHLELGAVAYLRRRFVAADASVRRSLALFRRLADPLGLSQALNNLSLISTARRRYEEATRLVHEDLALLGQLGDRGGETVALDNIALIEVHRGRYAEAVGHCVRSVELHHAVGSPLLACAALNILGRAEGGLGRHAKAATTQRRSHELARQGGNRYREAQALCDLAAAYRADGHPRRAVASGQQAVLIFEQLGDRYGTARAQQRIAAALADLR